MKHSFSIEDIEALRLQEGIDDIELRQDVRRLSAGACVRLTFLGTERPNQTLMVRITSIKESTFRGRLVQRPSKGAPSDLRVGTLLAFRSTQIHSIVNSRYDELENDDE
jgi:hypothetical protein